MKLKMTALALGLVVAAGAATAGGFNDPLVDAEQIMAPIEEVAGGLSSGSTALLALLALGLIGAAVGSSGT